MNNIIFFTGASSGLRQLMAAARADARHTVYASMRNIGSRNVKPVGKARRYAKSHWVDLRAVEMDVAAQKSIDAAVGAVIEREGGNDVLTRNAVPGAFTKITTHCEHAGKPSGKNR